MANFSLTAVFGLDAKGFQRELKTLTADTRNFVNQWGKIAAAAGVATFAALSKGAVDLASRLTDLALNIGVNVESLQALQAQHKRNGVSEEQLQKALEKTKGAIIDAAAGNAKANDALKALGLSAEKLIRLPLADQYAAIGKAAFKAKDQNAAFNAVTEIFGEKVGPRLMASLKELGEQGLPGVTKAAKEAGQVMEASTIAALDKAGDAIDDFKRRATVAIGNIIVNFRTEEGIKLLWLQFSGVVVKFGAGILDAVVEGGRMIGAVFTGAFRGVTNYFQDAMVGVLKVIAKGLNMVLPGKFEINVANLDELKSTGEGIADSITLAIAQTEPSNFKKTIGDASDSLVKAQQEVVNKLNAVDLAVPVKQLTDAGKPVKKAIVEGADALKTAGGQAGASIAEAARIMVGGIAGIRGGAQFANASDEALRAIVQRNGQQARNITNPALGGGSFNQSEAARLQLEAQNAQSELDTRNKVRGAFASGGSAGVFRAFPGTDPIILSRMIDQFARNLTEAEKTAASLGSIERGLIQKGIISRTG